jgi:hypothetical protein
MDFKVAKRLARLKLRPIMKTSLKYPTLLKKHDLKNFTWPQGFCLSKSSVQSYLWGNVHLHS